jgi:hypothetical protein
MPCVLAFGVTATVSSSAHSQTPLRVQRAEIMDRRGFERPLVAYTLFVPSGWRGQGEVEYAPVSDNCGPSQRLNWRAADPAGVGAIQIVAEEKWTASNFQQQADNCLHSQASDARSYLQWWVQRNRPGARILDYRPRPDLAEPFKKIAQQGNGMRSWGDAGEILIAYQHNGRPVREAISSASFYIHTQMSGMEMLQGASAPGFAMRMPDGALDFKMAEALRQSIRSAPEWQQRMNRVMAERNQIAMDHNRRMGEINRQGAADRSAIIANTSREINEIQMGTWQSRNESMDRQQRETIEGIRGVETYNDPHYGGTIQLSNKYQHAWQLRDGSYVLTDDPSFDPARALNIQGTKLRPTP